MNVIFYFYIVKENVDMEHMVIKNILKKNTAFTVGAVAYFVRHPSIPKIIKNKINFHIDIQWYINRNINTYLYAEKIFSVDKSTSYNTSPYKKTFYRYIR